MIRVITLTTYRSNNSEVIEVEFFRDKKFSKHIYLARWIEGQERIKGGYYQFDVRCYAVTRIQPDKMKNVDMMTVLQNTAMVMGEDVGNVIKQTNGKFSRKRKYVDVRKVAVMILFDMDFPAMDIERGLPFRDRVVYNYRTKMEDRFITEPAFVKEYEAIKAKVEDLTFKQHDK